MTSQSQNPHTTNIHLTQNKGKESENSYRKLKSSQWTGTRTHTQKENQNILTDNQKRANVCEHTTKFYVFTLISSKFSHNKLIMKFNK